MSALAEQDPPAGTDGQKRGLFSGLREDFTAEIARRSELATRILDTEHSQGLASVELAIRAAMTALGASLLEQLLAADAGHRRPRVDCGAGHLASFLGHRTKILDTVLGPIALRRAYYHYGDCRRGGVPRDERLDVTGVSLSPGLRAKTARAGAGVPFRQAAALLTDLAGITLTTKRVERSAEATGAAMSAAQDEQTQEILAGTPVPPPLPGPLPDLLYPRRGRYRPADAGSETTGRAGESPDGRARTREAKPAAVFTQTKTDDDGYPIRDPTRPATWPPCRPSVRPHTTKTVCHTIRA